MILPHLLLFADEGFTIVDVIYEYVNDIGAFFIIGATAFYFLLLRPAFGRNHDAMRAAGRSGALIGIVGALLRLLAIGISVNAAMMEKHVSLAEALTRRPPMIVGEIAALLALIAFIAAASASRDSFVSWLLAAIATVGVAFPKVLAGNFAPAQLVNPIHVAAASMWIGTLVVLVIAGVATAMSGAFATSDRGPAVASIVNRFSTLALWSAGVLVLSGVTTAYTHLRKLSSLWTTAYGATLLVKLSLVAIVFALGAYNNRRLKPSLGTEDAAERLSRSAKYEIGVAAIVLIVTAVLVNLPVPAELMVY